MHNSVVEGVWLLDGILILSGEIENDVDISDELGVADHGRVIRLPIVGLKDYEGLFGQWDSKLNDYYLRVWKIMPLNLFFLQVPLFRGSKSLKNYVNRSLFILVVFLISCSTSPTFSGMGGLIPVPTRGTSLT